MTDQRFYKLAEQVIDYSVSLKKGERILLDLMDGADDLGEALVHAVYKAGGIPFVTQQSFKMNRAYILGCTEDGLRDWFRYESVRLKEMDAYIVVRKKENLCEYEDIPDDKLRLYTKYFGMLHHDIRIPHTKWCVLRYPNAAMAQMANMSTEAFEEYYFNACCLDYRKVKQAAEPLARLAAQTDQIRIVAPGTDIRFSIKGLCDPVPRCGQRNIPCGETGMPIVRESANGTISYNVPSECQGQVFRDIRLTLKNGRITEATSSDTVRMNQILDTDENARYIGEFAMGFNPFLTRTTLDTLFDEKRAQTIHFTPGNSEVNPSALHWDIVQSHAIQDGGGEIWFDGVLVRKDGLFVLEELKGLNPENMVKCLSTTDKPTA